nr:transposase [Pantoea sp. VS1]
MSGDSRDSGNFSGRRMIWGGRSDIRSMLYMAVLSAVRYNPEIKAFYENLTSRGKVFKVAMTACVRKMITIINAMIRGGEKNDLTRWYNLNFFLLSLQLYPAAIAPSVTLIEEYVTVTGNTPLICNGLRRKCV